ncbi:hypothetical protein Tco_0474487 [Tanacetum coccineum]
MRPVRLTRECTYSDFLKCQPMNFKGTEGVVGLTQWFERMETVFHISNCVVENQVKFATCTLFGAALTWWNSHVETVGHDATYSMPWKTLMKMMTVKMFPEEYDKVEKYFSGVPDMIQVNTSSTDSQMHNNIMAAGSKERPPMLGPGRYSQWHSRFLRYLDTKSNGEYLRKCIFDGPYLPTNVLIAAVEAAENILPVAAHEEVETIHNMTAENKLYFQAEKEAIFLILTGIGDEIYSTVDACNTAKEMWTAIERLQQGESLNVQDVKTNLFWEFGKFTSRDGESMESYYSRFYKLMNELTRNNLQVSPMQVNVQFLQQLQPEWSRFVTVVKQYGV